ncbi:hypothetical protein HPL003_20765 [Paenibacillus terrae HPL-003]|uniref:Uncharacterized protein n=1 Tax=Paenibacillus terrae (strain HPL-003) TaxID=985665 RepID=G7VU71_PAETH|nr:hypothetical protein HPL003_20765 [Paenibacillus terrae HPL-003]
MTWKGRCLTGHRFFVLAWNFFAQHGIVKPKAKRFHLPSSFIKEDF